MAPLKYPRSIPFIISNEFCERFNFYGMRTILFIYLTSKLHYDSNDATVIVNLSLMFLYLCSLFGAILADSFWGKFKTIFILSIVYAFGSLSMAIGSVEQWKLPPRELTFIGLLLIAIGSGGIKPCVSAFGGEQFKLPEQQQQLLKYFSIFYFAINFGSTLSTFITPLLRRMSCFGMEECWVAGFGLPAALMIISIVIFASGYSMYKIIPPQGNMLVKVCQCIWTACVVRFRNKELHKNHWLDYAENRHDEGLIKDTKVLFSILVLFMPLPIFWALFDQQSTRWTAQAIKLDGDLGFYVITADQIQMLNPLLILIFIPLYQVAFYPMLKLIYISKPLEKMATGGILAGVAFLFSMLLQIKMDQSTDNKISILWQVPQYVTMTLAEVMFSVTGLEFAYTQAPESMKSVIQSLWMLTIACGDFIVALVVGSRMINDQSMEFLLFAVLMFLDMLIFIWLSHRYRERSN